MKTATTKRFNRLFLLSIISSACLLIAQTAFADRYYSSHGRAYYTCPSGYQLVLIPEHWSRGYFVPARYVCAPIQYQHHYRYYRDGHHGRHHYRTW